MQNSSMKSLNHCVFALSYHLVLVTKYRNKVLTSAMIAAFEVQARQRCEDWNGKLVECTGEADHVHLLIELPPTVALADFVNALKTGTSRRLRTEFAAHVRKFYWKPALWSRSSCVVSCGGAPLSIIKPYVEPQKRPL